MMRSATAFLPPSMMTFMNLDSSTLPYLGSGRISRFGTSRRRGISIHLSICFSWHRTVSLHLLRMPRRFNGNLHLLDPPIGPLRSTPTAIVPASTIKTNDQTFLGLLGPLGTVLGARLLAILDALQVERAAHDVIAHTRQILDPAAAHQHHAVLLQVVAFAADVRNDLETVGQTHLGDLAQRRVRLFRRGGVHTRAHTAALRRVLHRRALGLGRLDRPPVTHQLTDGWHEYP